MVAPLYRGGPQYRHGGYHHHSWGHVPASAGNGGLGDLGSWLDDATPLYAGPGQPTPGAVGSTTPVYQPAPSTGNAGPAPTTPQPIAAVIVGPQG
jgi:hypothetical protein